MRRREFIAGLASTAAWPLLARAQQAGLPVVAWFTQSALEANRHNIVAFHEGLAETGFIEGRNVTIEYRSANGEVARLAQIARELDDRFHESNHIRCHHKFLVSPCGAATSS
jgi:putative tryptophan/tyrosine transport system substrate-binding protein